MRKFCLLTLPLSLTLACASPNLTTNSSSEAQACTACVAPDDCNRDVCIAPGTTVVSGMYGPQPGQFGRDQGDESSPIGPMSLAVSDDEQHVYVLDPINTRVQIFRAGRAEGSIPIGAQSVVDLGLLKNGNIVLMDTAADYLSVIDAQGVEQSSSRLSGPGLQESGLADGMHVRDDGVWVETASGDLLHLLDADGAPTGERTPLRGQLSRDGKDLISMTLQNQTLGLLVRAREGLASNRTLTLEFDHRIDRVLAADNDRAGNLYVITLHIWTDDGGQHSATYLTTVSPSLQQLRRIELPTQQTPGAPFRYAAVSAQGNVFYIDSAADKFAIRSY